jgi:hypothetical protein
MGLQLVYHPILEVWASLVELVEVKQPHSHRRIGGYTILFHVRPSLLSAFSTNNLMRSWRDTASLGFFDL